MFHQWKSAQITDQDVIEFLDKVDAITEKDSSLMLKALFMIGVGEKSDGLNILKKVLQGMKSQVGLEETKEEELDSLIMPGKETLKDEEVSSQCFRGKVLPIFHKIQLEKESYLQNQLINTDHNNPICDITISSMSRYMTTTSSDSAIIWSLKGKPKKLLKVPFKDTDASTNVISSVDPKGGMLFSYKRMDNKIMYFGLDLEEGSYQQKEDLQFPKEFSRELLDSLAADDTPYISEMYFINEGKFLRCVQYENKNVRFADFDMETGKCTVRKGEKYEDRSVFKYNLTYVQHHESLHQFINKQESHGNKVVFPEKDFETWVVLEKDHGKGEGFLIYDIFNERIKRKISKESNPNKVFAVHYDSDFIVYAKGKNIMVYSLNIPDDIDCFIKPIYFSRDHNRNPAKIVKEKDQLCSKIMSLLKLYRQKKSQKFLIRIRKMMYRCFDKPPLLSYNNAFLTLYKTLIEDDDKCERTDIIKIHRTMVFNEIKFSNDLTKIRHISLPSNPDNNYLLLSIDGVIHKYDVSTKELLFSFKASAYRTMQIYDGDNKILTWDSTQVKIWHFDKDNTELITSLPISDKIEKFYAPPALSGNGPLYYVGIFQEKTGFKVYKDKLSEYWDCRERIKITTVDFTTDGTTFVAGTDDGGLYHYSCKDKQLVTNITVGNGSAITALVVLDQKYACVATAEPAVYICSIQEGGENPSKLDTNKNQITCMKTSWHKKLIVIGFSGGTIEFWKYLDHKCDFKLLKEVKEDFQMFDIDSLGSSMLILNPKWRDIEFHLIEWDWNTDAINEDLQNIDLDFENIKAEDLEDDKPQKEKPKLQISDGKGKKRSQTTCCTIF